MRLKTTGMVHKAGLPPGTLIAAGTKEKVPTTLSFVRFGSQSFSEESPAEPPDDLTSDSLVSWLKVDGQGDGDVIRRIGTSLGLPALVLEDILNTSQRPKFENHGSYLFLCLRMLRWDPTAVKVFQEHVSLVAGENYVVSFEEVPGDVFNNVLARIRTSEGRVREAGSDYLAYSLLDAIVDEYFVVLEKLEESLEQLEDDLLNRPADVGLEQIHLMRKETILLRGALWPLRELVTALERTGTALIAEETQPFLRDLHDNIVHAFDISEALRDIAGSMVEIYLSSVNIRMTNVMKVLTLIATIFIPLTFITSLYGMNFRHMPELQWRWGYPAVGGLMLLVGVGMVVFFRRRKWF